MLTFRTYLTKNDPDAICKIAASTGFLTKATLNLTASWPKRLCATKTAVMNISLPNSAVNRWLMSVLANFPMPGKGRLKFSGFQH